MYIIIKKNTHSNHFVGATNPVMHPNLPHAQEEAKRLATTIPGWEFIVCEFKMTYTNVPNILVRNCN